MISMEFSGKGGISTESGKLELLRQVAAGIAAQFGSSWNIFTDKGVAMKRDLYALLCQTGLCCRLAR